MSIGLAQEPPFLVIKRICVPHALPCAAVEADVPCMILERGGPPEDKGGHHPENGVYRNRGRDEPPYRPVSPSAGRGELFALKARFKLPYRSAIPATQEPREGLVSQQRSVFHVSGLPCYLQSTAWRPNCSLWRPCLGRAVVRVGAGKRRFGRHPGFNAHSGPLGHR